MSKAVTTGKLFDSLNQQLHLTWIAGKRGADRLVRDPDQQDSTLIGRTNFIHSYRIQILGSQELHYLNGVDGHALNDLIHRLFDCKPAMVILANNEPAPHLIFEAADSTSTPLLSTSLRASPLISDLQYYLQTLVADRETVHGVFMEVMGMGILLAGDCAVGKSELALELISRGHRLIADDAPEFVQIGPTMLQGTCPDVLQDFLEVRGLGILNVRAMFGDSVIKLSKNLKLIINLITSSSDDLCEANRLSGLRNRRFVLGIGIDEITLPVAPGRNLAVLIEVAVRDQILRTKGYAADEQLAKRQQELILNSSD